MARHRAIVSQLAGFNENVHSYLCTLHERVQVLEADNAHYREIFQGSERDQYLRSRSRSRGRTRISYRGAVDSRSRSPSLQREGSIMSTLSTVSMGFSDTEEDAKGTVSSRQALYGAEEITETIVGGLPTPTLTVSIPHPWRRM